MALRNSRCLPTASCPRKRGVPANGMHDIQRMRPCPVISRRRRAKEEGAAILKPCTKLGRAVLQCLSTGLHCMRYWLLLKGCMVRKQFLLAVPSTERTLPRNPDSPSEALLLGSVPSYAPCRFCPSFLTDPDPVKFLQFCLQTPDYHLGQPESHSLHL